MIELNFDGSCGPTNPGFTGGIGVVIRQNGEIIHTISQRTKSRHIFSNNSMEYAALNAGLEYLIANDLRNEETHCYGDSNLVIMQMSRKSKSGNGFYRNEGLKCSGLVREFSSI